VTTAVRKAQLIRLGTWTSLATVAVLVAVCAAYTQTGVRRIAGLFATEANDPARGARNPQLAARQFDPELEARRLNEQVHILAVDRDRLLARVAVLERNLDDVTGSIPPTAPAAAPTAARPAPVVPQAAVTPAPQAAVPPAVRIGPPATVTPAGPAQSVATKTDFGIDIGGDASVEGLRARWTSLKTNQPALLDGLRPVIAIRDGGSAGIELRLVAGPVANAAAAARLCAAFSSAGQTCQPAIFDGQRLALQ
jgi:hypothetical protein